MKNRDESFTLFIDDSGTRDIVANEQSLRSDGMDWFSLGGIIVRTEDIESIKQKHQEFCQQFGIDYPLHSTDIRGRRRKFGWLDNSARRDRFHSELEKFLSSLPISCLAVVVDRPGYVKRFKERYDENLWLMSKTAFAILVERATKFADLYGRKLKIVFEESGRREDRALIAAMKDFKVAGLPFDENTSSVYQPLGAVDFKRIILGEPKRKSKGSPLLQVADLVLYPMAKSGYEPTYPPYVMLEANKLTVNTQVEEANAGLVGIKYYCFGKK